MASDTRHETLEPTVAEHGVQGYTSSAVGGFGESYDHQMAQGKADDPEPTSGGVEEALRRALAQAHVDAAAVVVHFEQGHVVLCGTVRGLSDKHKLGEVARAVAGVVEVRNDLRIAQGLSQP